MVYRAIGLMSGSSLDGLDIVFAEIQENGGKWSYEIIKGDCYPYTTEWCQRLEKAISLSAVDYMQLHADYGHYIGQQVNHFINEHQLQYKVALVASHGHTTFHNPARKMTAQLGDGAAIAAETQLPVVTDLRAMDVAFGGQGAPIVPMGERLLLGDVDFFLNLGGIANISHNRDQYIAFDICPANRVLNMLVASTGKAYDDKGQLARTGNADEKLLDQLNNLEYYQQPWPKSLANDFGTDTIYPLIKGLPVPDALRTMVEHITWQVRSAAERLGDADNPRKMMITGGGALNDFLVERLKDELQSLNITIIIPPRELIEFKEALVMALLGVLRWREEYTVLSSVTGAHRDSVGGAMWMGQEE